MKPLHALSLLLFSGLVPRPLCALEVKITQAQAGGPLTAEISHSGTVGIHNDLAQQSQPVKVAGTAKFDLGTPKLPGFYQFTFIPEGAVKDAKCVTVFVEEGHVYRSAPSATVAVQQGAWRKFTSSMTKENLQAAWKSFGVGAWMAKNAVELAKVETACLVWGAGTASLVGAAPAQVAAPVCIYGNAGLAADFFIAYLEAFAGHLKSKGILTAAEHESVVKTLKAASLGISVGTDLLSGEVLKGKGLGGKLQKTFDELLKSSPAMAGKVVDFASESESTKLTARLLGDQTGKFTFLLKLK